MSFARRSNPSLTTALCASLAVHGLGLSALAMWFVRHAPPPQAPPFDNADVARVILHPPPPPRLPRPHRRPPPPPPSVDESQAFHDDSGEHGGHGTFNRSTRGEQPMTARRAVDQADLMRGTRPDDALIDPTQARTAQVGQLVSEDAMPLARTAPPRRGDYHPDNVATPPVTAATPARRSHALGPLPPQPPLLMPAEPTDDATAAEQPAPSGTPTAAARSSVVPPASPPRRESGRLAVASDTDSAAFTADADHTYHAGRADARNGKKVKFVNWEDFLGQASKADLYANGGLHAVIAVQVRTDATVSDARVVHSSGSTNVDEDIKRSCYYDQFEPDNDKAGHPIPTTWVILFD